jgi:hypothetical protein
MPIIDAYDAIAKGRASRNAISLRPAFRTLIAAPFSSVIEVYCMRR